MACGLALVGVWHGEEIREMGVVGTAVAEIGVSGSGILTARHDGMSSSLCGSGTAVLR